jgi:hypothetical protein
LNPRQNTTEAEIRATILHKNSLLYIYEAQEKTKLHKPVGHAPTGLYYAT